MGGDSRSMVSEADGIVGSWRRSSGNIFIYWSFWVGNNFYLFLWDIMSFENSFGPDGSININVVPSFGRIVTVGEQDKFTKISEVEQWRTRKGALHQCPPDFDPSRYVSFSTKEVVEDPVDSQHIHEYVERSRLSRRLGF